MNDLLKHFIAGVIISSIIIILGIILFGKYLPTWLIIIAFFLPLIAGIAKELLYDYILGKGTAEIADITLTWIGGAVIVLLWKFIENFI